MLDPQSAAILAAVVTELLAQAYFLTIRPESQKLEKRGQTFYSSHADECRRLQRKAQLELAERVIHSSLRKLYEKASPDAAENEELTIPAKDLREFEKEFDEIGRKYKEFASPGADLEALRNAYAKYADYFHSVWTGGVVIAATLAYGALFYEATGNLGDNFGVTLVLYLAGILAFTVTFSNLRAYSQLRAKIPLDEAKLLAAIHAKVQFPDEESLPAEVPAKARPEA